MKDLKQFIKTTIREFVNENIISNSQHIVYHGTDFDFYEFKTRRKVSGYGYSMGAYFSSSEKEAKRYGKNIKQYTLDFNKLLDLTFIIEDDKNGKEKFFNYMNNELDIFFPQQKSMIYSNPYFGYTTLESLDKNHNLTPLLKKKDFDGICFNEGDGVTFVVFNNKSIKEIQ
jgi:hypothetical protein